MYFFKVKYPWRSALLDTSSFVVVNDHCCCHCCWCCHTVVIEFCLWTSVGLRAGAAGPLHEQAQSHRWGEWWKHAYSGYLCHQGSRTSLFFSFLSTLPFPLSPSPLFLYTSLTLSLSSHPSPTSSCPFHFFLLFSLLFPIFLVCILSWSQGVGGWRTELLPVSYPPLHSALPHASVQLPTATGVWHPSDLSHSKNATFCKLISKWVYRVRICQWPDLRSVISIGW